MSKISCLETSATSNSVGHGHFPVERWTELYYYENRNARNSVSVANAVQNLITLERG